MLAVLDEPTLPAARTARLELRTTPEVKSRIEQAARSLGVNSTDFVVAAASRAAGETLALHQRTVISAENHAAFLAAFDATEPTPALVDLMRLRSEVARR